MSLDTVVRPVRCPRCGVWCLLGQCNGSKVAVSAQPLTLDGYRAALLAGLDVYRLRGFVRHKRLTRVCVDDPEGAQRLLAHPCASWSNTPLRAPQKAAQSFCQGRAGCTRTAQQLAGGARTCETCDPSPFVPDHLTGAHEVIMGSELGARVVAIEIRGKEVYRE